MNSATILVDNNKSQHRFLKCEHGFSLYLNYNNTSILFDFGATDLLTHNAQFLNINLSKVDYLVSSHSHYDHIDGIRNSATILKNKTLFVGTNFNKKKYAKREDNENIVDYLGANFDDKFLNEYNITKTSVNDKLKLSDDIYIVTNFKTQNSSTSFHRFIFEENDDFKLDFFTDELCIVIERKTDLVLIVGCSHPGILNIITKVNSLFDKNISIIIGGTHLSKASDNEIQTIANSLINLRITDFYFCHCSGKKITEKLKKLNQNSNNIGVGSIILL